ncbi:MAG: hypothetical protein OEL66_00505 [Desulfobulbaceae bacterium]|nr:hypothetical protein [Desulfobulbaceae bacterium]
MVVYEIKKPIPTPVKKPVAKRRDLWPVEKVSAATPVDELMKRWRRPRERQGEERRKAQLTKTAKADVRAMIAKANNDFHRQEVPIRLVLVQDEDGYVIDVYDCHDDDACRIVGDLVIDLDDLPTLLRNLERESGILLDTIS